MLQYDDSAFYFFALSILSFYLIPCTSFVVVSGPTYHLKAAFAATVI